MTSISKKLHKYLQDRVFKSRLFVFLPIFIFSLTCLYGMPTANVYSASTCSYTGSLTWGGSCSGYYSGTVNHGQTATANNTTSGYSGSISYSCSDGSWIDAGSSCTAIPPPANCSGSVNWGGGCSVSSVSINHNGSQSVTDSSFDDKGTATYSCNDGSFIRGSIWQCTLNPISSTVSISPSSGAMDTYFNLSWLGTLDSQQNGDDGVSFYKLQVNATEFDLGSVINWRGKAESLGLIPGSVNTFKVNACNSGGCSGWSPSATFTVNGGATPTLTTISLNPMIVSVDANFNASWSGNNSPTSYKLKIGTRIYNMFSATNITATPRSLGLSAGVYQLSAESCNAIGCVWSAPVSLTVTDTMASSGMWAWSNNIGWVNINCFSTTNGCPGTSNSNYGINVDSSGNVLANSYIWSDSVGWISFDRSRTKAPPDGSSGSIARYDSATGNFSGWARALSACQTIPGVPVNGCVGTEAGSASQGWDGWIKLSDLSPNYTVNYFNGTFGSLSSSNSWAWGSGVIGWLNFTGPSAVVPVVPPSGSITASSCSINKGSSNCNSVVSWDSSNFVGNTEVYQGNLSLPSRFSTARSSSGTNRSTNPNNNTFYLKDSGSGFLTSVMADVKCELGTFWDGGKCSDSFAKSIPEPPAINIRAIPNLVRKGGTSRIEVNITADSTVVHTYDCKLYGVDESQTPYEVNDISGNRPIVSKTKRLFGAQLVKIKCVVDGFPDVNAEAEVRVNVIPSSEET